jgi:hypothetical protein
MQPADLDLVVYKGTTFSRLIQWKTGDPAVPVNLTGFTARMQIRKTVNSTEILDTLTTENNRLSIYAPTEGRLRIDISAEQSAAYTFTLAAYDLEIVSSDTQTVQRLLQGSFSAVPEVTR